jgi:hypothetical protein
MKIQALLVQKEEKNLALPALGRIVGKLLWRVGCQV